MKGTYYIVHLLMKKIISNCTYWNVGSCVFGGALQGASVLHYHFKERHVNNREKSSTKTKTLAVSCFWLLHVAPCFFFSPFPACSLLVVGFSLWVTLLHMFLAPVSGYQVSGSSASTTLPWSSLFANAGTQSASLDCDFRQSSVKFEYMLRSYLLSWI